MDKSFLPLKRNLALRDKHEVFNAAKLYQCRNDNNNVIDLQTSTKLKHTNQVF